MTMTVAPHPRAQSILEALRWRYATKEFDTTRKVSDEDLEMILESICLAPTSRGFSHFRWRW